MHRGELHRNRIDDSDGKGAEIVAIECEEASHAVRLHGGHEPSIVGPQSGNARRRDQLVSAGQQFRAVG